MAQDESLGASATEARCRRGPDIFSRLPLKQCTGKMSGLQRMIKSADLTTSVFYVFFPISSGLLMRSDEAARMFLLFPSLLHLTPPWSWCDALPGMRPRAGPPRVREGEGP